MGFVIRNSIFFVCAYILLFSACELSHDETAKDIDTDGAQSEWSESCDREPGQVEGELRHPRSAQVVFSMLKDEEWMAQYPTGEISLFQGHTAFHARRDRTEFWLDPDDQVVFDYGLIEWGYGQRSDYELLVFSNFKPIPFSLNIANEESQVPTGNEVWENENIANSVRFTLHTRQPKMLTINIPSESFEGEGSYDVRIVALPITSPDDSDIIVRKRVIFSHAMTINIGEAVAFEPDELNRIEGELLETLSWPMDQLLFNTGGLFLGPPLIADDLESQSELANMRLGKRFDVATSSVSLNTYISGASAFSGEAGPVYMVVLRDSTVIEEASGWMPVPALPNNTGDMQDDSVFNYTMKVPVEVPLEDNAHSEVRVLKFPYPYCREPEEGGRYTDRDANISNTIFLQ